MKVKFLFLLLFATTFSGYSQMSFDLKGFGKIPYVTNADKFVVTFREYGSFDFAGTVQPLNLEAKLTTEDLKNVPGYDVLKKLEVVEVIVKLSPDGFEMETKADTKKKLKTVCEALQIREPYVVIDALVTPNSFEMAGILDFTAKPILINLSDKAGTRIMLEKFTLGAQFEVDMGFDAILYVKNDILFRPTIHDPDLKTVLELSFNMANLELKGAISMTDTWQDPFGMSHYMNVKKDDIIIANTAVELGWSIGSPVPTTIGFAVGYAKLFDIQFGMMMSIAPLNAEIAFKAYSHKITMEQFENSLRKMGLQIPQGTFPKGPNYYVDSTYILFAPNGGSVGQFEIEKGFAFRGGVNFGGMMQGSVDFFANLDNGFYLDMYMNARQMYNMLEAEIKKEKDPNMRKALEMALNTLRINEIHLHLSADKNMTLTGAAKCDMVLFGNRIKFDVKGSFNPKDVLNDLMQEITRIALEYMKKVGEEVVQLASAAATSSINTAKKGWNEVSAFAGHATTWTDHMTHGNECYTKCVPNRANKMSNPVLQRSNEAVNDFYFSIIPKLAEIDDPQKRSELITPEWNRLVENINGNWENVRKDDHYKGFDKDPDDVAKYGRKYRELVDAKKAEHEAFRNSIWNKLMSESYRPKPIAEKFDVLANIYFIKSVAFDDLYFDIPQYHFDAQTTNAKVGLFKQDYGIDRFIKIIPSAENNYVYLQAQHTELVFEVSGNSIFLEPMNKYKAEQLFKMMEIPGKENNYYLQSKISGNYLTANGLNESITLQTFNRSKEQQWVFQPALASDMALVPGEVFSFKNVDGNRFVDVPGSKENAQGKGSKLTLWDMDNYPDRYNMLINAPIRGYYYIQPLHSEFVWDMEGGNTVNGTKLQLWDLNKSTAQQFRFVFAGSPMTFYIENPMSGRFLDASSSNIKQNGCPIQLWDTHGGENQKWVLTYAKKWQLPPQNQNFHIKSAYSNKYWDIGGTGAETNQNGKDFKLWDLDGGSDRMFKIIPSGDHSWVHMVVQNGGRYVDVQGGKSDNGQAIQLYDKNGSNAQKFAILFTSPTTFVLITNFWKAVDAKGGNINDNGTPLIQWNTNYGAAQQFQLIYADGPKKGQVFNFLNN